MTSLFKYSINYLAERELGNDYKVTDIGGVEEALEIRGDFYSFYSCLKNLQKVMEYEMP